MVERTANVSAVDAIRALLRAQIEDVWGKGMTELVDANYAPDCIDHMPIPGQAAGREAMKQVVHDFRDAMPDLTMTLTGMLAAGNIGVDFWTLRGTQTGALFGIEPTGRRIEISGIDMVRVADGRIVELWHVEEMLQFWQQLGQTDASFDQAAPPELLQPTGMAQDLNLGTAIAIAADATPVELRNIDLGRRRIEGVADGWLVQGAPDLQKQLQLYVIDGDFVAARWTMTGTHTGAPLFGIAASGRRFDINGMDVVQIGNDGHIVNAWHVEELDRLRTAIS